MPQCSHPGCEKEIEEGWTFHSHEGYVIWRDPVTNQITHRHNTDFKPTPAKTRSKANSSELGEALVSLLVSEDDPKAEAISMLLRELGDSASSSKGAERSKAIESALNLVGVSGRVAKPMIGEKCQTCGHVMGSEQPIVIDRTTYEIIEQLDDEYEELPGPQRLFDERILTDRDNGQVSEP